MPSKPAGAAPADAASYLREAVFWWLPLLYLLISSAFYLRTYDSAQIKITLVQMGGLCLLGLWVCRLLEEGKGAFSREDLSCVVPFLAYLAYGVFSYLHAPYTWSSTDFFLRRIFYMTVPLIVVREFNSRAVSRLTRLLIWSAWIAAGYGMLQWFDTRFFPHGAGQGIDPFIWRGAFGERIFSTYGNPNFFADYLVIMFPILVCQYLKTREAPLLVLLGLDLFNLYFTFTKGAWIGLAISLSLLLGTCAYFLDRERLKRHRAAVAAAVAAVFAAALIAVAFKLREGFTSVNFRLFTWEATWEMIRTKPLTGTGLGSFWVVYPAFRRPPIFHIEGKHNTETDHAEDEYLETLFDEGLLGFGIFLWLLASTFTAAYRALSRLTGGIKAGERPPPRAYDLIGVLVAFQGMLAHNFFDVSLRFVSSGVYLGLLSGLVVNLARGGSLAELRPAQPAPRGGEVGPAFLLWPARAACWAGLAFVLQRFLRQFMELQGPGAQIMQGGESLQWLIAWGCFLYCMLRMGWVYARTALLTRNVLVPLVLLGTLYPLNLVWGFFRADVYHNLAIWFSKQQNWEQALHHYIQVGELNPAYIMSFYFKGNVFNDRFNMAKIYNPRWGDKDGAARDDFERALAAYEEVRARAPNYVQMHHQVGVLHMKHGEWLMQQGRAQEAQREWDRALERFELYRKIDPVFPYNYYRMGHIHMTRGNYDRAIETYKALIEARECRVDPGLAAKPWLRRTLLAYQSYIEEGGAWVHRHESAEAYTSLANAYTLRGSLPEAEGAYRRALALDPRYAPAQRNLEFLYQKARALGRPRGALPLPAVSSGSALPSFELVPSKR